MSDQPKDFCRLILFRHPQLASSEEGRAVGAESAELGHRGQSQMLEWLEWIAEVNVDYIAAPSQQHCLDPATALGAAKGLEVQVDDRLRDQELGAWQGRTWEEIAREDPDRVRDFFFQFGEIQAPEGESLGMAVERFLDWWGEHRTDFARKTICVVASGGMVSGFAAAMLGMRLSRTTSLQLPLGSCGVIDVFENGSRIQSWNPFRVFAGAPEPGDTASED
ncbi:MAG: histidine phosphatase family protein [Planctomycetota bacterium]